MYKITIYSILIFFFVACQNVERPQKPDNLIAEDAMVDVLVDSYLNNAAKSFNNRDLIAAGAPLDSLLYVKHGIDSLQFVESSNYYTSQINTSLEIFKKVELRLQEIQKNRDSIKSIVSKERAWKAKQDSVKKGLVKIKDTTVVVHNSDSIQ